MRGKAEERKHREESNGIRDWEDMCMLRTRIEAVSTTVDNRSKV